MEKGKVKELCDHVLHLSRAEETEVICHEAASAVTRFANNQIEQNVSEVVADIMVGGMWGKRVARVSGNRLDEASLGRLAERIEGIAALMRSPIGR